MLGVAIDPDGFEGLVLQRDVTPAAWITEHLWRGHRGLVRRLMPSGYEAYARIDDLPAGVGADERLREMLSVLAAHTRKPDDAWFCLWEGYGGLERPPAGVNLLEAPPGRPMRAYLVYRGPLAAGAAMVPWPFGQVPDIFWPADRSWFIGSDTDIDHGFIGATDACIESLARFFTVQPVTLDDPLASA